jgi:hypothetical protein
VKLQKAQLCKCLFVLGISLIVLLALSPAFAAPKTLHGLITLYGFPDNSPPGNGIAFPIIHSGAGGKGSNADPITFATAPAEHKPGTRVYVTAFQKYFIMEDECVACDGDWANGHHRHIDLWTNSNAHSNFSKVIACEDTLTQSNGTFILNPATNLKVSSKPLYSDSNGGTCFH